MTRHLTLCLIGLALQGAAIEASAQWYDNFGGPYPPVPRPVPSQWDYQRVASAGQPGWHSESCRQVPIRSAFEPRPAWTPVGYTTADYPPSLGPTWGSYANTGYGVQPIAYGGGGGQCAQPYVPGYVPFAQSPVVPGFSQGNHYLGYGLFGQPRAFGRNEPVRNFFRFLLP